MDDYSDNSDDEYGPVAAAWGDQSRNDNASDNGNAAAVGGWDSLVDPSFKIKANGIGSGNLHRRGGNYKPVNEEHILRQRLKLPPAEPGKNKKKSKAHPPPFKATHPPHVKKHVPGPAAVNNHKRSSYPPTTPQPNALAPPKASRPPPTGNSAWTQGNLVSEPFWERSTATNTSSASKQSNNSTQNPEHGRRGTQHRLPASDTTTHRNENAPDHHQRDRQHGEPRPQRPETMRPPPGLFRNAINQLNAGDSAGNTATTPTRPPGLSPIPVNPRLHHPLKQSTLAPPQPIVAQQQTPPQPINPVVIRINIELETGNQVQVPVRLYDDPLVLANEFSRLHKLSSPEVVMHLQRLFQQQQQIAISKRQMQSNASNNKTM